MDLNKELLEGLPMYIGGKASINLYNAGGGLYDERLLDESVPMPIEDTGVMPIGAFKALIGDLHRKYYGRWERCPENMLSTKIFFNGRMLQIRY